MNAPVPAAAMIPSEAIWDRAALVFQINHDARILLTSHDFLGASRDMKLTMEIASAAVAEMTRAATDAGAALDAEIRAALLRRDYHILSCQRQLIAEIAKIARQRFAEATNNG